jgi:hypothetical protein
MFENQSSIVGPGGRLLLDPSKVNRFDQAEDPR